MEFVRSYVVLGLLVIFTPIKITSLPLKNYTIHQSDYSIVGTGELDDLERRLIDRRSAFVAIGNQQNTSNGVETSMPYMELSFFCPTCPVMLELVETHVMNGRPEEEIEDISVKACVTMKITTENVCRGIIHSLVHEAVQIVKTSGKKSKDICGFVIGNKCEPPDFEQRFNWTVRPHPNAKPAVVRVKLPKDGLPTRRVLHLSDTHLDLHYEEGSLGACDLPLCCGSSVGIPAKTNDAAGKWGDYRNCDLPFRTFDHMMKHIAQNEKFDYIIWTGDLTPHDMYNQTRKGNLDLIHYLNSQFSKYFPYTPIFPALGNHDTHPISSFPQPDITDDDYSIYWLYSELSKSWPKLMLEDSSFDRNTLLKGGYYSVLVEPGFRIISLNMNYGNNLNFWLIRDSNDPAGQLAWLTEELGRAEANGEKVHLLGHIPPGSEDCLRIWGKNFRKIVNRFENTITAQFYGHTHNDELIVFHDEDRKRATNIAYIGPSTTPYSYVNPAYKIYTIDGNYPSSTRMVIDGEGFYMDLNEANLNDKPQWKRLYSFKESYGMESLTPADWSKFVLRLSSDDVLLKKFMKHYHRDSSSFPDCDTKCVQQLICRQVTDVAYDYSVCEEMGIYSSTN